MLGIQKCPKTLSVTQNVWLDFPYSGVCTVYKKWCMICYKVFVTPLECSLPEAMRDDNF